MKDSEQAQHALDFISVCQDIETGGYANELKGRDLTDTERLVKEKALRALSIYFGSTPAREDAKKAKRASRKKKVNASQTP